MSFNLPPDPGDQGSRPAAGPGLLRRRPRALVPTLIIVGVLFALLGVFTDVYTELLWFQATGYDRVFWTELGTRSLLFVLFGVLMGAAVAASLAIAYRTRPIYAPLSAEQQNLERYRQGVEPFRRAIVIGTSVLLGLMAGSTASGEWQLFLLWRNGGSFGTEDPQFGTDVGFYVFDLPFYRFIVGFLFAVVIMSLLASAATHYLYGGLRLQSGGERTSPGARVQLSVLLGLFVLLKAVAYWLDRYSLLVEDNVVGRNSFVGATYTDINAVLPAKLILAIIAVICAALFFVNVFRRGWLLPGVGVGLLLLSAILIGSAYPAVIQRFEVRPTESDKESDYIARNINGTRQAFKIEAVQKDNYEATTTVDEGQLAEDAETIPGIRLLDPAILSPTYRQLQQVRGYYGFPDVLDVDRYQLGEGEDGIVQDSVVAVRELDQDGIPASQRNWINDHLVYTHGFGFVAARGNTREANGQPDFFVDDIPPTGELEGFEPRIYFGEQSPPYSIVGAPEGAEPQELDYPDDEAPNAQRNTTYEGEGGVPIGSLFRKTLFAVKYREANILLNERINEESRILFDRHPRERVEKVAPWLTLDGNAYPAVVGDRILWIIDGYTTSASYPYANRTSLEEATETTLTQTQAVAAQEDQRINYIRNSVKATVDAYDGTVTLYAWDESDPILQAWDAAFPGTVTPRSEIGDELLDHLRYPEDLFKVQRALLARYHVTDPSAFYSGADFWRLPNDPTRPGDVEQPPYYLTLTMPGDEDDEPTFSLTTTYVPTGERENLAAFAAVNAEPGEEYGQIRALVVPRNTQIDGPQQVQNAFNSDPDVATSLNLLEQRGSTVERGNLLTLPVGGGLLYVQPVYVRASGTDASFPLLRFVLTRFGDQVGFAPTLQESLDETFLGDAGTETEEPPEVDPVPGGEGEPSPSPSPGDTDEPSPTPGGTATPSGDPLQQALADMEQALADAEVALQDGDFAAYGEAQQRLEEALERAVAATNAQEAEGVSGG